MSATTNIFGFDFRCGGSYESIANEVIRDVSENTMGPTNFITPNAHGINEYLKFSELDRFCKTSRYVLPDGQPIVWLSKLTENPIQQRLTGSDFFPVMFNKIRGSEYKCLFLVSNASVRDLLMKEKPDAVYIIPEFFQMKEAEKIDRIGEEMCQKIVQHKLNYIFIGISEPKQGALAKSATEKLLKQNYKEACVFFFLGASYEFYFGLKKRAPVIVQKLGLEWFYRLITEPKRMYKRYIFGNFIFVVRAIRWIFDRKAYSNP
ncbi:MAG: WecB/TagA/CpsF family glycosyltransferase [bacterium]|nr:WecB/TagA/CpsF family glycosyltransferase [bacterium]